MSLCEREYVLNHFAWSNSVNLRKHLVKELFLWSTHEKTPAMTRFMYPKNWLWQLSVDPVKYTVFVFLLAGKCHFWGTSICPLLISSFDLIKFSTSVRLHHFLVFINIFFLITSFGVHRFVRCSYEYNDLIRRSDWKLMPFSKNIALNKAQQIHEQGGCLLLDGPNGAIWIFG